jgi:hypothetical protein
MMKNLTLKLVAAIVVIIAASLKSQAQVAVNTYTINFDDKGGYSAEGDHVIPWQTEHVFSWRTSAANAVSAFQS